MTLKWTETAADCRIAEFFTPTIRSNFLYDPGTFTWSRHPDSQYDFARRRAGADVLDLIQDLAEAVPREKFWARTGRMASTAHGAYQIRRILERHLRGLSLGRSCACYGGCRYPQAPEDALD